MNEPSEPNAPVGISLGGLDMETAFWFFFFFTGSSRRHSITESKLEPRGDSRWRGGSSYLAALLTETLVERI